MSDALKQAQALLEQAPLNSEWPMLGVNAVIIFERSRQSRYYLGYRLRSNSYLQAPSGHL